MSFFSLSSAFAYLFIDNRRKVWEINTLSIFKLYENSFFCVLLTYILCTILITWWTFSKRKYFVRALNLLLEVDKKLAMMNVTIDQKRHKKIVLLFIVFIKCVTVLSLCLAKLVGKTTDQFRVNLFLMIPMYVCVETNVLFVFHSTFWMWAVKLRYRKINVHLRDNFSTIENENRRNENLNQIAVLHDKLVDVSELINRCYGTPVRDSTRHPFT